MQQVSGRKYFIVFLITLGIFISALWLSNFFSGRKLAEIRSIQESISTDILSSETQFALLSELSCKDVSGSTLSGELNSLGSRIEYGEKNLGNEKEITQLKKYYSLLEIKDFLLMQKIQEKCGVPIYSILYFYTTATNCADCVKQGLVLTDLRSSYPDLRVYSFDYNLDLSAVQSLISIYKVDDTKLPALLIGDTIITGFQSREDIETLLPDMVEEQKAKDEAALLEKEKQSSEASDDTKE